MNNTAYVWIIELIPRGCVKVCLSRKQHDVVVVVVEGERVGNAGRIVVGGGREGGKLILGHSHFTE